MLIGGYNCIKEPTKERIRCILILVWSATVNRCSSITIVKNVLKATPLELGELGPIIPFLK
jgi:hypothetical protein